RSSATRAIVPTGCVSRAASSFAQTASRRPPERRAISTDFRAAGEPVMTVSEASGKRQMSRSGMTGRRTLPGAASRGSIRRGIVLRPASEPPRPLAREDRAQAVAATAGKQLDVVLADARDALEVAARPGHRDPADLAAERRAVPGLAGEPARGGPGGVPRIAEVDDRPSGALLEDAARLGQLEADGRFALGRRLPPAARGPPAPERPETSVRVRPAEEGRPAFVGHEPHARFAEVGLLAEAERFRSARLRAQEGRAERRLGGQGVVAVLGDE